MTNNAPQISVEPSRSSGPRNKPRLLIIGHGRHGKDTFAELISIICGLKFESSSEFVGRRCIWPSWGVERYETFEECFADRVNYRKVWGDLIGAWNTPDKARTARTMIEEGCDMYVGMRRTDELQACVDDGIFDHIIWIDACNRLPKEPLDSMELQPGMANLFVDNNGPEENLLTAALNLQKMLDEQGFYVGYHEPVIEPVFTHRSLPADPIEQQRMVAEDAFQPVFDFEEPVEQGPRLTWLDMPEGATPVLDHGFIQLKDHMGSDKAIAESARMSYGRGTKKVNNDQGLINYLVRNHHTSPLEMGEIKVHMRLPIFVMRQWVRHRTANLNEYSGRYSEMVRLWYVPEDDQIKYQGLVNKQMSGDPLPADKAAEARALIDASAHTSFDTYEELLNDLDVSRETARIVLPLNTYTEVVWKMDVSNLLKFLWLRDDEHAQWEIRVYAIEIAKLVKQLFPMVYAAYERSRGSWNLTEDQLFALMIGNTDRLAKGEAAQCEKLVEKLSQRAIEESSITG